MAGRQPDLAQYITVAERIIAFREKFPEGSLQAEILVDDGKRILICAKAFRTPNDMRPGIGHAEKIRGDGPVNRTSAIENGESSAWGRALAALGFEVKHGIASREEVQIAKAKEADGRVSEAKQEVQDNTPDGAWPEPPPLVRMISPAQRKLVFARAKAKGMQEPELKAVLDAYTGQTTTEGIPLDKLDAVLEEIGTP